MDSTGSGRTRRAVVLGAGCAGLAVCLTGCATYGGESTPAPAPAANGGGNAGGGGNGGGNAGTAPIAQVSDIPVGGGKVFADRKVVITQPTQGEIKAFSAVCTHAGCTVDSVSGGTINCPCHGSQYSIEDGSVVTGPATAPLASKDVSVKGKDVVLG